MLSKQTLFLKQMHPRVDAMHFQCAACDRVFSRVQDVKFHMKTCKVLQSARMDIMATPATAVARKWNEAKTRADLLKAASPQVRKIFDALCKDSVERRLQTNSSNTTNQSRNP